MFSGSGECHAITYSTISKVVPLCEVTPVVRPALVLRRKGKVLLGDVILTLYLFRTEASVDDAKEARVVDLSRQQLANGRRHSDEETTE